MTVWWQAKDVTHLWELGGGTSLCDLVDVPINAQSIGYVELSLI
jgi:hypothetical protein